MALLAAAMVGLAFASVPLYRLFCQVTGFGGTPLRADSAPGAVAGKIGVRFDANINPALPWRFEPVQETVRDRAGRAHPDLLPRDQPRRPHDHRRRRCSTSRPTQAGKYFSKIECFCFTEQTLKGGQSVDMPVVFFVDPKIREDEDTKDIDEITLELYILPGGNSALQAARAPFEDRGKQTQMAATQNHDYHLVDPDPWPIIGAICGASPCSAGWSCGSTTIRTASSCSRSACSACWSPCSAGGRTRSAKPTPAITRRSSSFTCATG